MLNLLKENVAMLDDYINASQQIYCDKRVEVQRHLLHQKEFIIRYQILIGRVWLGCNDSTSHVRLTLPI